MMTDDKLSLESELKKNPKVTLASEDGRTFFKYKGKEYDDPSLLYSIIENESAFAKDLKKSINENTDIGNPLLRSILFFLLSILAVASVIFIYSWEKITNPHLSHENNNISEGYPRQVNTAKSKDEFTIEHNIEYINYSDRSCIEEEGRRCVDNQQYEYLCNKSEVLTVRATNIFLARDHDMIANYLINNGARGGLRITWNASQSYCSVRVTISGIYQGSQVGRVLYGRANSFIYNDTNDLAISHVKYMYSD